MINCRLENNPVIFLTNYISTYRTLPYHPLIHIELQNWLLQKFLQCHVKKTPLWSFRSFFQLEIFLSTGAYVRAADVVSVCKAETFFMTCHLKALSIDFFVRTLGDQ